jgi:hypothetical protein
VRKKREETDVGADIEDAVAVFQIYAVLDVNLLLEYVVKEKLHLGPALIGDLQTVWKDVVAGCFFLNHLEFDFHVIREWLNLRQVVLQHRDLALAPNFSETGKLVGYVHHAVAFVWHELSTQYNASLFGLLG